MPRRPATLGRHAPLHRRDLRPAPAAPRAGMAADQRASAGSRWATRRRLQHPPLPRPALRRDAPAGRAGDGAQPRRRDPHARRRRHRRPRRRCSSSPSTSSATASTRAATSTSAASTSTTPPAGSTRSKASRVTKELQLLWMKNVAAVRYTVEPPDGRRVQLSLLPFVSLRDFHSERHARRRRTSTSAPASAAAPSPTATSTCTSGPTPAGSSAAATGGTATSTPIETDRGLDDTEDLFQPGRFTLETDKRATITLWAELGPRRELPVRLRRASYDFDARARHGARSFVESRVRRCPAPSSAPSPTLQRLARAANDFVVYRKAPDGTDGTTRHRRLPVVRRLGPRHVDLAARAAARRPAGSSRRSRC